jgi:hypothetical protein
MPWMIASGHSARGQRLSLFALAHRAGLSLPRPSVEEWRGRDRDWTQVRRSDAPLLVRFAPKADKQADASQVRFAPIAALSNRSKSYRFKPTDWPRIKTPCSRLQKKFWNFADIRARYPRGPGLKIPRLLIPLPRALFLVHCR